MGIKILIVDDEKDILGSLKIALEFEDFEVDTADSPNKALQMIEKHNYPIVLTDIAMPEMTGIALLQKIKRKNPLCNVIMMTGQSTLDRVVEAIESGAADYLLKPFDDMDLILDIIRMTVARVQRWRKVLISQS